ncbi:acyl-CoA thioesterase [Natronomonas sp.]|uniref:acyl-CoA thioesterase n=1 Tax=Natronomonas sp. TaxID=2184060 RepID=UPI0039753651
MFEDEEGFNYATLLRVRLRDLDHMKHVNNSVYATYMEQARMDYFTDVLDLGIDDVEMALASSHIEFEKQVRYGGQLRVQIRVPELGTTSFPFEYRFVDSGDVAATARTVQVVLDTAGETTRPIPDTWRERITAHEGIEQEK